ncbi:unnamed protein product [Rotaria sordida]|uniref:Uncharacterized protein n=1 Tax=Rotaria sordida TaxID=392033 RepID=A0A819LEW3_9BILA|nr:unnamed protein product [Rotaria sordida]CAF3964917.1 unnamed protein product [Rotaria sordida]
MMNYQQELPLQKMKSKSNILTFLAIKFDYNAKIPAHLSIRQRWKTITLRFDNNLPLRQIASTLQCSCRTVKEIIDLFEETDDFLERQCRGRHAVIHGPVRKQFRQIMSRYPTSTSSSISTRLQSRTGQIVCVRTNRRVRKEGNYYPVRSRIHLETNEIQAIC